MNLEERTRYPHTSNYWKRTPQGNLRVGSVSEKEFLNVKTWHTTEKLDGSNIRVLVRKVGGSWIREFYTREGTDVHITWHGAKQYLSETFTMDKLAQGIEFDKLEDDSIFVLYGELFGSGIQKHGGLYSQKPMWAMFDARLVTDRDDWWLEREAVDRLASKLGVMTVPHLPLLSELDDILKFVMMHLKDEPAPPSNVAIENATPRHEMEGIVARADPMMLSRKTKTPVQFKLKFKDFPAGGQAEYAPEGEKN